jgi:hypothetical protein
VHEGVRQKTGSVSIDAEWEDWYCQQDHRRLKKMHMHQENQKGFRLLERAVKEEEQRDRMEGEMK